MKALAKRDSTLVHATETISSPSHCLREILENSLDAGCTIITVRIGMSGLEYISVSDDGPGISENDLRIICEEGITSKTFGADVSGGRGQALQAISYLSYLTIESATDNSSNGFRLQFSEDHSRSISKITRPKGTTVTVQTLFHNHPVRRHYYLEHKSQQMREIIDVCTHFAIASEVSLTLICDNKITLQVPSSKLDARLKVVLGSEAYKSFDYGESDLGLWNRNANIRYYTASPNANSINKIMLVVNNRPCLCEPLNRAIHNEFRLCAEHKSPSAILYINAPRDAFDFLPNSPLISVLFSDSLNLYKNVTEILSSSWKRTSEKITFKNSKIDDNIINLPASPKQKSIDPLGLEMHSSITIDTIASDYRRMKEYIPDYGPSYETIETNAFKDMEIIGQWNRSFIITKYGCDIYAIDQHAAMEAQNFEKLRKSPVVQKQKLIQPLFIKLTPFEMNGLEESKEKCAEFGYDYEVLEDGVKILSIPSQTKVASGAEDLIDLVDLLKESPGSQPLTPKARKWMAYRACHSSVRVGDTMSISQMKKLLDQMANSDFPWNCPHGRPTWCEIWSLNDPLQIE